jgi:hypothetical protein
MLSIDVMRIRCVFLREVLVVVGVGASTFFLEYGGNDDGDGRDTVSSAR